MRTPALMLCTLLAALPATAQTKSAAGTPINAALADPARPAADRDKDAARHPADVLAFAQVRPGAQVADFIMGGGYWTRLMSDVVGPKGKVYAYQPAQFIQYKASYATDQDEAVKGRANVVPSRESLGEIAFPAKLDAILTVQNWHDLHLKDSPPGFGGDVAKKLYASLKPGGVLVVIDHVGTNPTPFAVADTQHRGDSAATRKEIEAAGFRYDGKLDVLANPADPHTAAVFDPAIRGHTDQFAFRFKKPR